MREEWAREHLVSIVLVLISGRKWSKISGKENLGDRDQIGGLASNQGWLEMTAPT